MNDLDEIEVGKVKYKITRVPDLLNKRKLMGCYNPDKGEILIDSTMPKSVQEKTLLHELLHAVIAEYGVNIGRLSEENLIDQLCTGIYEIIMQLK